MGILHRNLISPQCCPLVEEYKTVFLRYKYEPDYSGEYDDYRGYVDLKPSWAVKGVSEKYECEDWVDVACCPHCGKHVPEIEPNPLSDGVNLGNQDQDYCHTCRERNMVCRCLPPWFAWRPKGVDTPLPVVKMGRED